MKKKITENGYSIVIGGVHFNALGVIRSLGEAGVPSVFINVDNWSNASYSKYTLKTYYATTKEEILEAMRNAVREFGGKPTVFPCSDGLLRDIADMRDETEGLTFYTGFSGNAQEYMRKDVMSAMAKEAGFTVPQTEVIEIQSQTAREQILSFGFPCIIKPISGFEGVKIDIRVCKEPKDVDGALSVFAHYKRALLQRYVDGKVCSMIEFSGCKTPGTDVCCLGELHKIREFPPEGGSTSYATIVADAQYLDIDCMDRFLNSVGFSGIFNFDIKVVDSVPYFLEINYRSGATTYGFTKAGFNIPAVWHYQQIGKSYPIDLRAETFLQCEGIDFSHVLKKSISLTQWIHDFSKADAHMILNHKDIRPAFASWRLVKAYLQSKF